MAKSKPRQPLRHPYWGQPNPAGHGSYADYLLNEADRQAINAWPWCYHAVPESVLTPLIKACRYPRGEVLRVIRDIRSVTHASSPFLICPYSEGEKRCMSHSRVKENEIWTRALAYVAKLPKASMLLLSDGGIDAETCVPPWGSDPKTVDVPSREKREKVREACLGWLRGNGFSHSEPFMSIPATPFGWVALSNPEHFQMRGENNELQVGIAAIATVDPDIERMAQLERARLISEVLADVSDGLQSGLRESGKKYTAWLYRNEDGKIVFHRDGKNDLTLETTTGRKAKWADLFWDLATRRAWETPVKIDELRGQKTPDKIYRRHKRLQEFLGEEADEWLTKPTKTGTISLLKPVIVLDSSGTNRDK